MRLIGSSALALALFSVPALAAEPQAVATYKDWSVFVYDTGSDKICFAATEATDKSPKAVQHGDIFFMVASWKSGAAKNQPSLRVGYNLKDGPDPTIRIGSDSWEMYPSENEAFIESSSSEQGLVTAMRKGATMRISATSSRGTATSYVFSLTGVSAALDRAAGACK
ncbi:MAG: invasion associated locus B family protein [Parvularculaceae bacterium]